MNKKIKKWVSWKKITKKEVSEPGARIVPDADSSAAGLIKPVPPSTDISLPSSADNPVPLSADEQFSPDASGISGISDGRLLKSYDFSRLPKVQKDLINEKIQIKFAEEVSRINEIKKPDICALCGSKITKDYFIVWSPNKLKICRGCRQTIPRCTNCGDLIKDTVKGITQTCCADCRSKSLCTACGAKFPQKSEVFTLPPDHALNQKSCLANYKFRLPGKKGLFCADCIKDTACPVCGIPIQKKIKGEAGNTIYYLCSFCASKAILSQQQADETQFEVLDFLYSIDKETDIIPLEIRLISYDPAYFQNRNQVNSFYVHVHGNLSILTGTPVTVLMHILLDIHIRAAAIKIPSVNSNINLLNAYTTFVKMLFYENCRMFIEASAEKEYGLKNFTVFQPMYKAFYKMGIPESYAYINTIYKKSKKK